MKAIQIQSHGDLEVLKVKTLPDPDPDVDELLVRIKASAVNPSKYVQTEIFLTNKAW